MDSGAALYGDEYAAYGSGYGAYLIGSCDEQYYGSKVSGATFGAIAREGYATYQSSNGDIEVVSAKGESLGTVKGQGNVSEIDAVIGVMTHSSESVGLTYTDGTIINTAAETVLYRSSGHAAFAFDNAVVNPGNGIIGQMIDDDDSTVGMGDFSTMGFNTKLVEAAGMPSTNGSVTGPSSTCEEATFTFANGDYAGDIYNGTGYYGQAGDVMNVTVGENAALTGAISLTETFHGVPYSPEALAFAQSEAGVEYVLLDAPGAPVKQALLDAGIGRDIDGSYEDGILQPFFSVVARQAEASDRERFEQVIRDTLTKLADEGLDQRALASGINYFEFRFREADYASFPKGLIYGIDLFDSWLYDDAHPFAYLHELDVFEDLKKKAGEGYFEGLIRKELLENPHQSVVILTPQKGLSARREKETAEKMAAYKAGLSEEELDAIVAETKALQAYQEEEDPPEALETIPLLSRSDISKEFPVPVSAEESFAGNVLCLSGNTIMPAEEDDDELLFQLIWQNSRQD